jgi:hypothetical protein
MKELSTFVLFIFKLWHTEARFCKAARIVFCTQLVLSWEITDHMLFVQVIDLSSVSPDLEYIAADADLVILEGMVCDF